jgi:hypothetical protein
MTVPRPQDERVQQVSAHKFMKKPVVIEGMRIPVEAVDGEEAFVVGHASIADWFLRHGFKSFKLSDDGGYDILTLEGTMHAKPGDWIIRGFQGEFYPCKPDIFDATYAPATAWEES